MGKSGREEDGRSGARKGENTCRSIVDVAAAPPDVEAAKPERVSVYPANILSVRLAIDAPGFPDENCVSTFWSFAGQVLCAGAACRQSCFR